MRPWFLCAALAVFLVSNAAAQTGTVCLYADPQGTQCNISDTAPGILSVYVIHSGDPSLTGAIGVAFAAPKPECMVGATWLTDMSPFPAGAVQGNSRTGVWVSYGGCVTPPTHVLTIQYMTSGMSQTDCAYGVVADPYYGAITVATCDLEEVQAAGGVTYVNSVLPCVCSGSSGLPLLYVTPTSIGFGQADTLRELTVSNGGGGVLTWSIAESAPWLTTNPASGTGVARVDVQVDRTGLPIGVYSSDLIVTSNGGTVPVHVSMEVVQALFVSPQSLTFEMNTTELILHVESTGPEPIPWTVDCNRSWLTASPTQWVDDGDVRVRVNRSGLAVGTYTGVVTVTGAGQTISVPVTMKVGSSQGPGGTIGVFSDPQALSCNLFDSTPGRGRRSTSSISRQRGAWRHSSPPRCRPA